MPPLALEDDKVGLARALEEQDGVAELGVDHVVRRRPEVPRPPLARLGLDALVVVRRHRQPPGGDDALPGVLEGVVVGVVVPGCYGRRIVGEVNPRGPAWRHLDVRWRVYGHGRVGVRLRHRDQRLGQLLEAAAVAGGLRGVLPAEPP